MISQKKLYRIKMHLVMVEEKIGELRTDPRRELDDCPIGNFCPEQDKDGNYLSDYAPTLEYEDEEYNIIEYDIYTQSDWKWWKNLSSLQRQSYTKEIIKWLKERNEKL